MSLVGALIIFTILTLFFNYVWARRKYYYLSFKMDSLLGYPFIGNALIVKSIDALLPALKDLQIVFPRRNGLIWFGPNAIFYVRQPSMVKKILTSPDCTQKLKYYEIFTKHFGAGIISSNPPVWNSHRKMIEPAFHVKIVRTFFPIFNKEMDILIKNLTNNYTNIEFNIIPLIQLSTIRITCQTTMGIEMKPEDREENEKFIKAFQDLGKTTSIRSFNLLYHIDFIFQFTKCAKIMTQARNRLRKTVTKIINGNLNQNEDLNKNKASEEAEIINNGNKFITKAIELYKSGDFTFDDVINESSHIILGGYDSTANTVSYTIMCLAMFPEYQDKVFEELLGVFPNKEGFEVSEENLKELRYLEMVINENMRLMAPIPVIGRSNMKEISLFDDKNINLPQNTQIFIDIFNLQRDEAVWGPKAQSFYPDHFDPENLKKIHSYAFIPFTKGQRSCIGSRYGLFSVKTILAKLLRKFKFTTDFDYNDLKFIPNVLLKIKKPPLLRMYERTH